MKFEHYILCAALMLLSSCSQPEEKESSDVHIIDPRIDTTSDALEYLEAAVRTGAVKVTINGHVWRFHTPFHSNLDVRMDATASYSFQITERTSEEEIRDWLEKNKTNWIRYIPSEHSDLESFWTVIDAMEEKRNNYALLNPEDNLEGLGRLEAVEPMKEEIQPVGIEEQPIQPPRD